MKHPGEAQCRKEKLLSVQGYKHRRGSMTGGGLLATGYFRYLVGGVSQVPPQSGPIVGGTSIVTMWNLLQRQCSASPFKLFHVLFLIFLSSFAFPPLPFLAHL